MCDITDEIGTAADCHLKHRCQVLAAGTDLYGLLDCRMVLIVFPIFFRQGIHLPRRPHAASRPCGLASICSKLSLDRPPIRSGPQVGVTRAPLCRPDALCGALDASGSACLTRPLRVGYCTAAPRPDRAASCSPIEG